MSGETNLALLLQSMEPKIVDGEFVFISIADGQYGQCQTLQPKAMFIEDEGMTLVVPKQLAQQQGYPYHSVFKCITLTVHSSLDAVGLTAAFANILKQQHISANVIAGFYHDHIFVPSHQAKQALAALTASDNN